ncbi:MAG: response regulator [Magnetococcales bacterium]|nr:response regulator [Magnetococcales bacterium]
MDKILLVDDDLELCSMIAEFLVGDGFSCETAHDGQEGLKKALGRSFDALVLDVMMPKMNGFDVVRKLRESKDTPVIMLTARGDETDSIIGLEIGADDYLAKPCSPQMLVAHLRAVLRRVRGKGPTPMEPVTIGKVTLRPGSLHVEAGGEEVELTSTEFTLLHLLMKEAGQVISKEVLCEQGLGRKLTPYDRSVDIHISNIRRKLKQNTQSEPYICTVRGSGYQFVLPFRE